MLFILKCHEHIVAFKCSYMNIFNWSVFISRVVIFNSDNLCRKMEKAMAPHSSTLAWKIPWAEEPGGLQSMGSLRVGHGWATSISLFTFTHWRRKWHPTPAFLPGESQGWGSLVGCRLWSRTESDTLKWLSSSSDHKTRSKKTPNFEPTWLRK